MNEPVTRKAFVPTDRFFPEMAKYWDELYDSPLMRACRYDKEIAPEIERWLDDGGRDLD